MLTHTELNTAIEHELQNNPLLEAEAPAESSIPFNSDKINALAELPGTALAQSMDNPDYEPNPIEDTQTMEDRLLRQLHLEASTALERKIGEFIIGNLDADGYLNLTPAQIAAGLGITDEETVKKVLTLIQNFDPIGIATANFEECLVVQLNARNSPHKDLAVRIIEKGLLNDLALQRYEDLAKQLSASNADVAAAGQLIASLEPKPARNQGPAQGHMYAQPDLYMYKDPQGQYVIETNKNNIPQLKINLVYRNLLNKPGISSEERAFIQEKLTNALNFIKSIHQRGQTLTAIARYIVEYQKEFFDGEDAALSPLALKDVASHLERCESTISRAVSNKYIETPRGFFPLKYFFTHAAAKNNEQVVSCHGLKQKIAELIEEENKNAPLSDQDIQSHLDREKLHLARRTIAKYRRQMDIPPAHSRKAGPRRKPRVSAP